MELSERQSKTDGPAREPAADLNSIDSVLGRNIRSLKRHSELEEQRRSVEERLANAITAFAGTMAFVYIHAAVVAFWLVWNSGWIPGVPLFDRSYIGLATAASVEAIFLSTFVLIAQNLAARAADRRAELDLQISLLAEHEVTRLVSLTRRIAKKLDIEEAQDPELKQLEQDVAPEAVLDTLQGNG